jgi:hypothetical protein
VKHLSFERLVDVAEGRLAAAEAEPARAHVASCSTCATALSTVAWIIHLMRLDAAAQSAEEPPEHVVNRALRLVRRQPPARRNVIAQLLFDSAARPLATAGVRAFDSSGRQLVFAAGDYELDLRLTPTRDQRHGLRGQLLGPCTGDGRVVLAGPTNSEVPLNELCEFEMQPVSAGTYALSVHLQDVTIEVGELELQS